MLVKNEIISVLVKLLKNIFFVLLISFVSTNTLFAATINFSPATGTYNKDATFSVGIYVASPDQAMNAASATIKFPTDKLQVVSVSKSGTIVDFWAQEPTFSNSSGEVRLEGVVLTPGYQGSAGKILTINFKGKTVGTAGINISTSSVLANDGIGTNILKSVSGASFVIKEAAIKEPEVIKIEDLKPVEEDVVTEEVCEPDSIITSTTHPGVVWRRENTAAFSWDIDKDTLASKIAFDRNPDTEPDIINSPAIVEKRYENVEDGIWYFHLSLQNNSGWQKTEHFKIKIDHTPPSIEATEIPRSDLTDPKPIINLKVNDKISCVKNFEFSINGEVFDYEKLPNGDLRLETIEPGSHELVVTAYDRAGNKNEAFLPITVKALEVPEVTDYPAEINVGEKLVIKGETIPNGNVEAKITSKKNNFLIREELQSASGKFTFEEEGLKKGIVFASFRVTDIRGAKSEWSKPVEIRVNGDSFISSLNINDSPILILVGLLLAGIIIVVLVTRAITLRKFRRDLDI